MTRTVSAPRAYRWLLTGVAVVLLSCGPAHSRDLADLDVVDSLYVDPESGRPYTGAVHKAFDDPDAPVRQLEGRLEDGTWNGELTVYHEGGRIRFQGTMRDGQQCGAWTEDEDPEPAGSVYAEIRRDLESLVMYPACGES